MRHYFTGTGIGFGIGIGIAHAQGHWYLVGNGLFHMQLCSSIWFQLLSKLQFYKQTVDNTCGEFAEMKLETINGAGSGCI